MARSLHHIRFVEKGLITHSPWVHLKKQIFLGAEDFVNKMQSQINLEINLTDIPRAQYTPIGCSLMQKARPAPLPFTPVTPLVQLAQNQ